MSLKPRRFYRLAEESGMSIGGLYNQGDSGWPERVGKARKFLKVQEVSGETGRNWRIKGSLKC